ncbi:uncharacterized protein LOC123536821 [Mercenaria mercenaria]|uniref:uncharacterized protein LOC123536821 n=1 Tax=Mercenaria mercenaria TaxID=6596 RepID=UPI00234E8DBC|nr:uncharacterized protein LOC123536821 [Mercenaria mercenaria]
MPKNYTEEDLFRAVSAVKRNQLTVTQAAKEYGLPRTTLTDHIKYPESKTKKGPQKQLNKEESDGLVAFVLYMAGQGFPMTRRMVRCYVQEIVRRSGRTTLFNLEKGPSDEWFRKLKADYPQLAFRKPENRERGRSRMSNKKVVNDFFQFWIKAFLPNCGRARPVLLLMDNHDSHISLPLIEKARTEGVILVGLPSHTTHFLQPLDVRVIGPLKEKVETLASSVGFARPGCTIGKSRLPVLLSYAIDSTPPTTVKEAFRLAGIMPVNPEIIDVNQLIPPTFAGDNVCDEPEESTQTCETCGQFIGQNPLVERGVVPASLAEVLVPPPAKPLSEKKKMGRVVTSGRVISGDEMLQVLKEREAAQMKKQEEKKVRDEEREIRRKKKLEDDEMKVEKRRRKEAEKAEKEQEKLKEKERKEKYGKLTEKKYTCGVCDVRGRINDEMYGIEWYGCDNDTCKTTGWYHFECLSEAEKAVIRESLDDEDVRWYCKACFPRLYEEE